uniref:Pseudouridylate synthase RPUSD4, mitochondrial n=1 Tax=Trichuris muris TaxID=70415 RepID=A0A5S6QIM3_TRIMR
MAGVSYSDTSEDRSMSQHAETSGLCAFDVVQRIRKNKQEETIEEMKKNDVDGSLVALYKIHSLIPDLFKMEREEVVHLCANSVIYNKDDLLVLNKPYGISVTEGPAQFISLQGILPALRRLLVPKSKCLVPVHRLDRCTTGVLMIAASQLRLSELRDMFARREITKKYLCLTKMVPEPSTGVVNVPIGEKRIGGNFKMVPLLIGDGKNKGKYRRCTDPRIVETKYEVVKQGNKCALVECTAQSGAKHQIRSHLGLSLGTPIVGDHKYSNYLGKQPQRLPGEVLDKLGIRSSKARHLPMYLHASEVEIPDFVRGHNFHVTAELPKFFTYTMKKLHLRPL